MCGRLVADIKSTTSKIKYYKTKQYSTIKKTGFTTSAEKTKKYWWTSKQAKQQEANMNYMLNMNRTSLCSHSNHVLITLLFSLPVTTWAYDTPDNQWRRYLALWRRKMAALPSIMTQYPIRNTAHMTYHMIPGTFQWTWV